MNTDNVGRCGHAKCAGGQLCYEKGAPMTTYQKEPVQHSAEIVYSMEALTIEITLTGDGEYQYKVWPTSIEHAATLEESGDSTGDDNGGVCTGNMGDALGMAHDAALSVVRAHFYPNVFNADVCPSSLDENGEPLNTYDDEGEIDGIKGTEHKSTDGKTCDECGATITN